VKMNKFCPYLNGDCDSECTFFIEHANSSPGHFRVHGKCALLMAAMGMAHEMLYCPNTYPKRGAV
jgi:hypothetical protein